ncbi:hypothetical protein ACOMHN_011155 [Nucella lapillus]
MSVHRMMSRSHLLFLVGITVGLSVSFLLNSLQQLTRSPTAIAGELPQDRRLGEDPVEASLRKEEDTKAISLDRDLSLHHDDDTRAKELYNQVRILVWVMTGPQNLDKRAVHVRNTWGKRANQLLFMSSERNDSFPTIGLDVEEGRAHLTAKTMRAFQYVYENHLNDADWFMKVDDDTYVIMENLRYMLSSYNTRDPIYFGKVFRVIVKQGYASGGAGYVLSKEALRRLVTFGTNVSLCKQDGGPEDANVGKCLSRLGVKLLPSTDRLGRSRFHCFAPEAHLNGRFPKWFIKYDVHGGRGGMENISDYPISFHYIVPRSMYALEYFTYHLRPYGIVYGSQDLQAPFPPDKAKLP